MTVQDISFNDHKKHNNCNVSTSWWSKVQTLLINAFTPETSEPKIVQKRDRAGNYFWYVYDPVTEKTAYMESETEVLQWLEQRYYEPAKKLLQCNSFIRFH